VNRSPARVGIGKENHTMKTVTLSIPDISCEHCERTITGTLAPVSGVSSVAVDIPAKQVRVEYDETTINVDQMKDLLAEEEYPVESVSGA
jgi:copper chaperone